ncbi:MAG TPA: PilZ domain-containing protein [Planctomycetota bacterium]|nr:PilZ domain-containing protein [Planctomycetota bacterium]
MRPGRATLEKPRRARVKVDLTCEITGSKNHATAHVANLTIGGCRLLSPCAFPKGETVRLALSTSDHEPELKIPAEIRWLALNPEEGPFEVGCRFVHSEDTADRVEKLLRNVIKRKPHVALAAESDTRSRGKAKLVFATEGLDQLLRPGLSAPLRESPGAPRAGSGRS